MKTTTAKMDEILVRDIMTRGVVTAQYSLNLHEIAEMMSEDSLSCVVIVDQSDEAAGIISCLDLVKAFSEKSTADIERITAEELMTPHIVEAYPDMNLKEVANIMVSKNVHRVIVLSPVGRKPVGVLSDSDIVKQMQRVHF